MNLFLHSDNQVEKLQHCAPDDRWNRNIREDLKMGIDAIYQLKERLDLLHPLAKESLIKLIGHF